MKITLPRNLLTKKNAVIAASALGLITVASISAALFNGSVTASAPFTPLGKLDIEVFDGATNSPIEGADVFIVETGGRFTTAQDGSTGNIDLPVLADERYEKSVSKPWGEVTLLCYKDGYVPYALFGVQVYEDQARQGPKVYMFEQSKKDGSLDDSPFSIVEGPQRMWVSELLEKYRPSAEADKNGEPDAQTDKKDKNAA